MSDKNIQELVTSFKAGSREAFASLVRRYQNLVTSVAFANTGDVQRSEDIAQQVFLVAWQKQNELKDPKSIGGWLRSITNNLARNERRLKENVRQQSAASIEVSGDLPNNTKTPDDVASQAEQNAMLWNTLDQIPIEYRESLILFYREDQSVAAVAAQMGLSKDAVKQRLKRGRAMLKQELESQVEEFLSDSRPSKNFSTGVLAAIPLSGTLGSTALKATAAAGGKAIGGKVGVVAAGGAISGIGLVAFFGILFGALVGVIGSWHGTKKAVRKSTSEEEKQLHWKLFYIISMLTVVLVLYFFCSAVFLRASLFQISFWLLFPIELNLLVYFHTRTMLRQRQLQRQYGASKGMESLVDLPIFEKQDPDSMALNTTFALVGSWAWMFISLLLMASATGALLASVILVWLLVIANRGIDSAVTCVEQLRIGAKIIWQSTVAQAALMAFGKLSGLFDLGQIFHKFTSTDLSPSQWLWIACFVIFVLGGSISLGMLAKAELAQSEVDMFEAESEPANV